jgi:hypothetical protein
MTDPWVEEGIAGNSISIEAFAKPRGFAGSQKPVVSINSISIRKRWRFILATGF